MRVSLKWLRDYVAFDLPTEELAQRLTMAGLEVESIERVGSGWENVVVGHVLALEQHPNADRLKLATVGLGGETLTVVCGAPNVAQGQKVPFARVGASLINPETGERERLKAARIRGVRSEGMICSERELGLGDDHTGIVVLPPDAPAGAPLAAYLGDTIFDLEVTPNRPDWMSVLGVAWEVAALIGGTVRMPDLAYAEESAPIGGQASVEIRDPDLCPRYIAALVTGVRVGPSPAWMQERLKAGGMRPINNVVDVTNYILLEYGQPLHAFDFATLRDRKIVVRRARPQEPLRTLDGELHELTDQDLVIADAETPVALAGIMGGAEAEVSDRTTAVLIESANFHPSSIRRTAGRHKMRTEASVRFEKGLSPELPLHAIKRATQLMVQLCGGRASRGFVDVYPAPRETKPVRLDIHRVARVLGANFSQEKVAQTLSALGLIVRSAGGGALDVIPPYWRTDLTIPEDLMEEIARIIGYEAIPTTLPQGTLAGYQPRPMLDLKRRVRQTLVSLGMQEVITYSLASKETIEQSQPEGAPEPLHLWNPMSPEQEYLRTTLRGSLLRTFAQNERSQEEGLRLFELGRVYLPRSGGLPEEKEVMAAVFGGARHGISRFGEAESSIDFFDAKGILEGFFARLDLSPTFEAVSDRILVPGRTARILLEGEEVGLLGEVHPDTLHGFEIATPVVILAEVDLERLLSRAPVQRRYSTVSRYPGVVRDLALVVDQETPAGAVEETIRRFPAIARVILFDVYTGEKVPPGKKSLAFRVVWQSPTRTLAEREVEIAQNQLLAALKEQAGAELRG
ncbi:MAG: phenylalanine--tRNA ligase subunit beta [Chloroflexi bacterium]|nr:phenylalanine--tRNA ligase subunit beta [Chloroflexota bacterium]